MQEELYLRELLTHYDQDEIETTRHLVQQLEGPAPDPLRQLRSLTILLTNKNLPARQRRDVAGVARIVADSGVFVKFEALIHADQQTTQAICLETLKLVGAICW